MPDKPPVRVKPLGQYTKEETASTLATSVIPAVAARGAGPPESGNQPLSQALIERTLRGLEITPLRDRDGDICTVFTDTKPRLGSDLNCWFMVSEPDTFRVLCTVDPKVPQSQWSKALYVCNAHHATCRYGRALLPVQAGQSEAGLFLDAQVLLLQGTTEDFLGSFIMTNLASAHAFLEMAYQQGLYQGVQSTPLRKRLSAAGKHRRDGRSARKKGSEA